MAKNNEALSNFSFDNDDNGETFFGVGNETLGTTNVNKVIGNVKEDDDFEDEDEPTKLDAPKTKEDKQKEAAQQKQQEKEEDDEVTKLPKQSSKKEEPQGKEEKPKPSKKAKDEDEDDEEEEVEFFKDEKKDEKPTSKEKIDTKGKEQEKEDESADAELDYTALALALKDKGTLNFDIKEDDELTEDDFLELHEQEVESRVEETIDELTKGVDEEGKAYLKFLNKGGKSRDFFATYKNNNFDLEELDEEDKGQVSRTLRYYLTSVEGKTDEEEIEDRIKYLQDSGKDKTYAVKYFKQIKDKEKAEKEKLDNQLRETRENNKAATKKFNDSIADLVAKSDSILGVPFTSEDKKKIPDYLTRGSVKVGANKFATPFQVEITNILRAATPEYKQKLLIIAKLAATNFEALKDLAKESKTEVVKEVRRTLRRQRATNTSSSTTDGGNRKRSLADVIEA